MCMCVRVLSVKRREGGSEREEEGRKEKENGAGEEERVEAAAC